MPVLLLMLALAAASASADPAFLAQEKFREGKALYQARSYAAALSAFESSLRLFSSPNTRLYQARSLRELGRWDEALMAFERADREAAERARQDPRYLPTQDAAHAEGGALSPRLGRLAVRSEVIPPHAHVWVAGRELPTEALGIALPALPGRLRVEAKAPGYAALQADVLVKAGTESSVHLAWVALPPPADANHVVAGVMLGVAGAAGAGGGILWYLTNRQYHAAWAACAGGPCSPSAQAIVTQGQNLQLATQVTLGVGVASLLTAGVFGLFHPVLRSSSVELAFNGTGAALAGSF